MLATTESINGCNNLKAITQPGLPDFEVPVLVVLPAPKTPAKIKQDAILTLEKAFFNYAAAASILENYWAEAAASARNRKKPVVTHPDKVLLQEYDRAEAGLRTATAEALASGVAPVDLIMALAAAKVEADPEDEDVAGDIEAGEE